MLDDVAFWGDVAKSLQAEMSYDELAQIFSSLNCADVLGSQHSQRGQSPGLRKKDAAELIVDVVHCIAKSVDGVCAGVLLEDPKLARDVAVYVRDLVPASVCAKKSSHVLGTAAQLFVIREAVLRRGGDGDAGLVAALSLATGSRHAADLVARGVARAARGAVELVHSGVEFVNRPSTRDAARRVVSSTRRAAVGAASGVAQAGKAGVEFANRPSTRDAARRVVSSTRRAAVGAVAGVAQAGKAGVEFVNRPSTREKLRGAGRAIGDFARYLRQSAKW